MKKEVIAKTVDYHANLSIAFEKHSGCSAGQPDFSHFLYFGSSPPDLKRVFFFRTFLPLAGIVARVDVLLCRMQISKITQYFIF